MIPRAPGLHHRRVHGWLSLASFAALVCGYVLIDSLVQWWTGERW